MLVAGLEQQRDVGDGDGACPAERDEPLADAAVDLGMDDRFELGARGAIVEHDPAERGAVEGAVGGA